MSLGPMMLDVAGTSLTSEDREILAHPLLGGVILFARNYENPQQVKSLIKEIHALRKTPLLIAVDQEGGRVQRFQEGFTRLPAAADLGVMYNKDRNLAIQLAEQTGWINAAELREVGADLNFAPVLDLDYATSSVIGDRSFHRSPEVVADIAHSYMRGMEQAGMSAVGKHFPGHGAIAADSHETISIDDRSFNDIRNEDMLAFERMIHFGMPAIMIAHIIYSQCHDQAAGFSGYWLRDILRGELDFQGAIFTDDLSMKGAAVLGDIVARAQASLEAGCDMFLVCNDRDAAIQVLDAVKPEVNPASNSRLLRLQGRRVDNAGPVRDTKRWHQAAKAVESYSLKETLDLEL